MIKHIRRSMTREEFGKFVEKTLVAIILIAEEKCGTRLPRKYSFRWLGRSHPVVGQNIVDHIIQRVFVDDEHIYPCVDLGVADLKEDGSLLIVGSVAGYSPRPFGCNWTGQGNPDPSPPSAAPDSAQDEKPRRRLVAGRIIAYPEIIAELTRSGSKIRISEQECYASFATGVRSTHRMPSQRAHPGENPKTC